MSPTTPGGPRINFLCKSPARVYLLDSQRYPHPEVRVSEPDVPASGNAPTNENVPVRLCLEGSHQEVVALLHAWLTPPELQRPPTRAFLTPDEVRDVRDRIARGESKASVARLYGTTWQTIHNAVSGRTWKGVPN